jgi:acyl-CoA thioesterase-1
MMIGTSLTAGLGLDPDDAFPAVIQRMADSAGFAVRIVAAGLSGETSAGALRRAEWLLDVPPDIVLLETGANDGLRGLPPDSTAANLRAIMRVVRARAPLAQVIIAQMEAPPNLGAEYTGKFRDAFGTVARETGATLMPFLLEGVAGDPRLNQDDGIHPNVRGARRVAENVWSTLKPVLATRGR